MHPAVANCMTMSMISEMVDSRRRFYTERSVEIDAAIGLVFARWSQYEDFPQFMASVRHAKRIDERKILWDVDILGRQIVWEARIIEHDPQKRIRWTSCWGSLNRGEVRFESLPGDRTCVTVEIEYQPRGLLEQLGARSGLIDLHVDRELARFRRIVEKHSAEAASAS